MITDFRLSRAENNQAELGQETQKIIFIWLKRPGQYNCCAGRRRKFLKRNPKNKLCPNTRRKQETSKPIN